MWASGEERPAEGAPGMVHFMQNDKNIGILDLRVEGGFRS